MATIVEGPTAWSATIRCAQANSGANPSRVDGCFALIKITLEDIEHSRDYEGDITFWVTCPACKQRLYPQWQTGRTPLMNSIEHNKKKGGGK